MAWIESHQSLATHRKTKRLKRSLAIGTPEAIGHLHLLWYWCVDNAPTGDLTGIDPMDLAEAAEWPGKADVFLAALIDAGFIDQAENKVVLHDWLDYQGTLMNQRATSKEQRKIGGQARMAKLTPEERTALAREASNARWHHPSTMPAKLASEGTENGSKIPANASIIPAQQALMPADASNMPGTVPNQPYPTNIPPYIPPLEKPDGKKPYGEFKNVRLTDDEFQKLTTRFNGSVTEKIESLSEWKKSKNKHTASDYATILSWDRRDQKENLAAKERGSSGQSKKEIRNAANQGHTRPRELPPRDSYESPEQYAARNSGAASE